MIAIAAMTATIVTSAPAATIVVMTSVAGTMTAATTTAAGADRSRAGAVCWATVDHSGVRRSTVVYPYDRPLSHHQSSNSLSANGNSLCLTLHAPEGPLARN
jgi:hypothetical protein